MLHERCRARGGHRLSVSGDSCTKCGLHGKVILILEREDTATAERDPPTERMAG